MTERQNSARKTRCRARRMRGLWAFAGLGLLASAVAFAEGSARPSADATPSDMDPGSAAELYEVLPHRPAADAGMRVGDIVQSYHAEAAQAGADIAGAADLLILEMQWSDLGSVTLRGRSGDSPREWHLKSNGWGIKMRPLSSGEQRLALDAALTALVEGKVAEGCAKLAELGQQWSQTGRRNDALWAEWRCQDEAVRKRLATDGDALMARLGPAQDAAELRQRGLLAVKLAAAAYDVTDWKLLDNLVKHAIAAFEGDDPRLRSQADLRRGKATVVRGQYADVLDQLEPVAISLRRLAPDSLRLAAVQNELAWANLNLDRLDEAERLLRNTLTIARQRSLNEIDLSKYQGHLAIVLRTRNDLDGAEREMQQALQRLVDAEAGDKFIAPVWNNLGVIRRDRGDYVGAEDAFRQSMEMEQRRAQDWVSLAITYGNMAAVARARGDLASAQRWAERARPILLKSVPDGTEVAQNLHLLGSLALDRGRLDEAGDFFARSIEVWQKIAPRTLRHAFSIEQLGAIAQRRGDFEGARRQFDAALEIRRTTVPNGLEEALSWYRIGVLELEQSRLPEAQTALEKAVAIDARLAPDHIDHVKALHALGCSLQGQGESATARETLCRAADILDKQRARLSRDPKEQAEAMAQFVRIRQDCVSAEAQAGNAIAAFDTLERGRGRALLAMLAQRDLTFAADLPNELRREWAAFEAELERLRGKRAAAAGAPGASTEAHLVSVRALEDRRAALLERLRIEAPRFAALQFPQPLGFAALREHLADNTAVVAITVGNQGAYAFVARQSQDRPIMRKLTIDRSTLGDKLAALRIALLGGAADPERAARASAHWYTQLIAPIAADLDGVERLVIIPDSELFALPYAALRDASGHYLLERFSVSVADSATLWAATKAELQSRMALPQLLAVANGAASAAPGGSTTLRGNATLPPLPYADIEVARIAKLNRGRATVLTDASATETRVEALARDAGRLHFAVHSLFDPVAPLESGLVLHSDAEQTGAMADGLLQVWEIFDGWRTPAQLVTLSGCDTGQGAALADEGLVGLTRAFQFAGARNVVASLWSVSDRSTAELMTRFYRELARGAPVDLALRAAQVSMLRNPTGRRVSDADRGVGGLVPTRSVTSQPSIDWTWAAFQVYGGG